MKRRDIEITQFDRVAVWAVAMVFALTALGLCVWGVVGAIKHGWPASMLFLGALTAGIMAVHAAAILRTGRWL